MKIKNTFISFINFPYKFFFSKMIKNPVLYIINLKILKSSLFAL